MVFSVKVLRSGVGAVVDRNSMFYIYANNPESAFLKALRWYDFYVGNRDKSIDARQALTLTEIRALPRNPGNLIQVYSYIVWYITNDGKYVGSLAFGRNKNEAITMAKKYFPVKEDMKKKIIGVKKVERVK